MTKTLGSLTCFQNKTEYPRRAIAMCGRQEIWKENGLREDFADGDSGAAPPLGSCSMVHISPQ